MRPEVLFWNTGSYTHYPLVANRWRVFIYLLQYPFVHSLSALSVCSIRIRREEKFCYEGAVDNWIKLLWTFKGLQMVHTIYPVVVFWHSVKPFLRVFNTNAPDLFCISAFQQNIVMGTVGTTPPISSFLEYRNASFCTQCPIRVSLWFWPFSPPTETPQVSNNNIKCN